MAAGGIFTLIANDGKADRLINAADFLKKRIRDIRCEREQRGEENPEPTLLDIEKTHILFTNASYKPFVSMAYEYNKVRPQSGNTSLGGQVQFSIPQFGDFFNDMVAHIRLGATSIGAGGVCPALPVNTQTGAGTAQYITTTYRYVNAAGTVITPGAAMTDFLRYCEYPGCRVFQKTDFTVNGNPLDFYHEDAYAFYQKFFVKEDDFGFKRCMGQEYPIDAYGEVTSVSGLGGKTDTCRRMGQIMNGPQTPKASQPALDLWVPLLFWFNLDPRLAIPSVAIPFGQRFLTMDIASLDKLLFRANGALFLETTTTTKNLTGVDTAPVLNSSSAVVLTPTQSTGSSVITSPNIEIIEMYINNIFVIPEVHDIFIERVGFNLIRVNRYQKMTVNVQSDEQLLNNLKYPIEYLMVGLRPTLNQNDPEMWHRFIYATTDTTDVTSYSNVIADPTDITATAASHTSSSVVERLTYRHTQKTVDKISITVSGIHLYEEISGTFFNSYVPHMFGGHNVKAPREDEGALFVNFCLYPKTYQPSGHINVSRAREFYLKYWSSIIPSIVPTAELIVLASAINFLLITDGSAVLRYTT
ncbi:MAG: hypothetical protein KAS12_01500 [Candidatus Aenigmarchaeota archaeon]|nr:hypothetical protein [Candidatus Aenigmarchaeota archaeon]